MMRVVARFDRWMLTEFRASAVDLAVARVIVAGFLLSELPRARWISRLPDVFFDPPLSVAAVWSRFPSPSAVTAANLAAVVALTMLLLGWRTRPASIASTVLLVVVNSFAYATGKIDHNILIVVAPMVMASSGWGDTWSLDALQGRVLHVDPDMQSGRWSLAWLSMIIALAMSTAAVVKAASGWLDLATSSSFGHAVTNAVVSSRDTWLGSLSIRHLPEMAWEFADWTTVLLESAGLVAMWRRRWFMWWCAGLALFHLLVALQMNIWFATNLMAYAIFVPWSAMLVAIRRREKWSLSARPVLVALVVALWWKFAVGWMAPESVGWMNRILPRVIVLASLPVGVSAWLAARRVEQITWSHRRGPGGRDRISGAQVPMRARSSRTAAM